MTMQTTELYKRIRVEIESIPLLDTHEHLMSEEARLATQIDFFYWFSHYASCDLVSAGMSQQTLERLRDADRPLDERWAEFAPFWEHARTTAYGRALLLAAHDLFEIDDINEATYAELSQKISASNSRGWYDHVLKERANIELAILDPLEDVDPTPLEEIDRRLFAPVLHADGLIVPCNRIELRTLESKTGVAIHSLDDLLTAMDLTYERAVAVGVVGIKVGLAYQRSLHFDKVAKADAERVFNRLSRYPVAHHTVGDVTQEPPVSWAEAKPLQDYLLHQAIRRAIEHHLPIQIHTGLQEGNGNLVSNANPLHLVNLLLEYEEARFDLFHAGYPYQSEMATLGKNFANVYVDLCWVHVISPWVARQTLHEWIETIPANKIFAFGGDYIFVEGTYAHSRMARDDVAEVLAEKVELGYLTEDEAIAMARKLLRDNAVQFFRLPV
jgi:predicted TIM-barrel fold metal-dependent hydrolase